MRPLIDELKEGDILVSQPVKEFFEIKYLGKNRVRLKRVKKKFEKLPKGETYLVSPWENEYYGKSLWAKKTPEGLYLGKRGFLYKVNKGEKFLVNEKRKHV